jgi:hypothetical protein
MPERRTPHRALYLTWAALVLLTLLGALSSRGGAGAALLCGFAVLKAALIALVFMELRRAHPAWSLMVGAGVLGVAVVGALAAHHAW